MPRSWRASRRISPGATVQSRSLQWTGSAAMVIRHLLHEDRGDLRCVDTAVRQGRYWVMIGREYEALGAAEIDRVRTATIGTERVTTPGLPIHLRQGGRRLECNETALEDAPAVSAPLAPARRIA